MRKLLFAGLGLGLAGIVLGGSAAQITVEPWVPLFQGVDLAAGHQQAQTGGELNEQVRCLRVDLWNPDIRLVPTPKFSKCGNAETTSENTSHFLERSGLQVAVNGSLDLSSSNRPISSGPEIGSTCPARLRGARSA